jgi:tetratricopeptide (TPR) repeat protein
LKSNVYSHELQSRFLIEQKILARLQHPNIAQILDGGVTENDSPYFVLEYVAGTPIDEYCNKNSMTIKQRLNLFKSVCYAVHYAHQNLVIHRDLKPGHILVTDDGIPKLLDFGIAKLLDSNAAENAVHLTQEELRLLTPEYASPEQICGLPISTASDIYSLGVILYELLTGHLPYSLKAKSPFEMEKIIREKEPLKPSIIVGRILNTATDEQFQNIPETLASARGTRPEILRRQLADDLDNIILKALQKEPHRRYGSAEQLTEDIQRFLDGLPVKARKTTLVYRTSKFIKRHRTGVLASVLVVLSLIVGLGMAMWQNQIAQKQRDLAVDAANTMVFELAKGLSRMSGPTEDRLGLLNRATEIFKRVSEESDHGTIEILFREAEARRMLSQTYRFLGDANNALKQVDLAEKIARELIVESGTSFQNKILLSSILVEKGDALTVSGRETEALSTLQEAIVLAEPYLKDSFAFPDAHNWFYSASIRIGDRLFYLSRLDSAAVYYQQAFEISKYMLDTIKNNPDYQTNHATSIERLADVLYYSGKVQESCQDYREALDLRRTTAKITPMDVNIQRSLSIALQNTGWCAEQEKQTGEAIQLYLESIGIQKRLFQNDPANTILASALMGGLGTLANLYYVQGDWKSAVSRYRESIQIGKDLISQGIQNTRIENKTAILSQLLADLYLQKKMYSNSDSILTLAESLFENLNLQEPANTEYMRQLGNLLITRAELCYPRKELEKEKKCMIKALQLFDKVSTTTAMSSDKQRQAFAYYKYAQHLIRWSDLSQAKDALLKAKNILLNLRENGQLSDQCDGYKVYLPAIEAELANLTETYNSTK